MPAASASSLSADEQLHWLALRMTPGLGAKTAIQLVEAFRTPQALFRASKSEIEAAGASVGVARNISSGCAFEDAVTQQQRLAESGAFIVPVGSKHYPVRLKEIYDPPPVLFARGRVELLEALAIAVVGTRHPTTYGTAVAGRLATDLSNAGLTIASGMARGIDTAAHRAVLEAAGNTIAVFGCGVDELYPAENKKLAGQLAESGLILSDFPMGTPPYPQNFPIRNRIISGISLGVLIVEGGQYSGSAITARLAAEHGREVFAVPGNVTSKMSWGPNLLIKQGAKLVQDWNDVVTELQPADRRWLVDRCRQQLSLEESNDPVTNSEAGASAVVDQMTEVGRACLFSLKTDAPVALDHLVESLQPHSASEIIAALFELELSGLVRQLPGKSFLRVWLG